MPAKDLEKYTSFIAALLEPFDDSQIKQREGSGGKSFSYVPPEQYRYRALEAAKEGFEFGIVPGTQQITPTGIFGIYRLKVTDSESGAAYEITVPAFEKFTTGAAKIKQGDEWVENPNAGKPLSPDQDMNKLTSAGFKATWLNLGLGLHLYDKATSVAAAPGGTTQTGGSTQTSGDWDGTVKIKGGNNAGKMWKELTDKQIDYLCNLQDPNRMAIQERERRKKTASAETGGNAGTQNEAEDDLPF